MRYLMIIFLLMSVFNLKAEVLKGDVQGKVTLVEYFDYNCPICRGFAPTIEQLILNNPQLKVIQRVVPVLAPTSEVVDSLVLASALQHKFAQTERAVLIIPAQETIPFSRLAETVHTLGLNVSLLNTDMQRPIVQRALKHNLQYFNALDIHQIPVIQIYLSQTPNHKLQFVGSQSLYTLQSAINFTLNQHGERYVKQKSL